MTFKNRFDTERASRDGPKSGKATARTLRRRNGKDIIRKIIKEIIEKGDS